MGTNNNISDWLEDLMNDVSSDLFDIMQDFNQPEEVINAVRYLRNEVEREFRIAIDKTRGL